LLSLPSAFATIKKLSPRDEMFSTKAICLPSGQNVTGVARSMGSISGGPPSTGILRSLCLAGQANTTGSANVYVGVSTGTSAIVGNNNTLIGAGAGAFNNLSFATAIGSNVIANLSNSVFIGRTNDTVRVQGTLVVSTLGSSGSTQLCRNGSNQISTCSSSMRYKTDVAPFNSGLRLIQRLRPITFKWKDGERDVGLAAEEVEQVEPLLVTYRDGLVEGVKYGQITTALVNAVREQQEQIERQQKQIAQQQRQIDQQQKQIQRQGQKLESLEALVCRKQRRAGVCK
jgi:hypothetical protein